MKKLFGLLAIVLTGLLIFAACPNGTSSGTRPGTTPGTTPDTVSLEKIKKAYDVKWGVKEAANASEVATGKNWVTKAEMAAFNRAIEVANNSRSIRSAEQDLDEAIAKFEKARKGGSAEAFTLSGTITVTHEGQPVPYVRIIAYYEGYDPGNGAHWTEETRIDSSSPNTQWSIITKKSDVPNDTKIAFVVDGFKDNYWDYFDGFPSVFWNLYPRDFTKNDEEDNLVKVNYSGKDVRNINIVLNTITLSGTLNVTYGGKPVPFISFDIFGYRRNGFGNNDGRIHLYPQRSSMPWSVTMQDYDENTVVTFSALGGNSDDFSDNLFSWDSITSWEEKENGVLLPSLGAGVIMVKDKSRSGIVFNLGEMKGTEWDWENLNIVWE